MSTIQGISRNTNPKQLRTSIWTLGDQARELTMIAQCLRAITMITPIVITNQLSQAITCLVTRTKMVSMLSKTQQGLGLIGARKRSTSLWDLDISMKMWTKGVSLPTESIELIEISSNIITIIIKQRDSHPRKNCLIQRYRQQRKIKMECLKINHKCQTSRNCQFQMLMMTLMTDIFI